MICELEVKRRVHAHLIELDHSDMRRSLRVAEGVNLSSNDYLGLAHHPLVKERMVQTIQREGCGSTGSRLLSGHRETFARLERRFARWKRTEGALFFGCGYLANLGVMTTFPKEGDVIFSDELNHASLIDGMRLSKARTVVFRHADLDDVARLIEYETGPGQKFLVTESVFSMDGDEAPLAEYAALSRATETALIVDEAHAVGVWGARGSGLIEEMGIESDVFISINPAGKALGVGGAFVTGENWAIDYLVQCARPLIFSTAPPPAIAGALDAALDVIEAEPERRARLLNLSVHFREKLISEGLQVKPGCSQIVPIVLGDSEQTVAVSEDLQAQGFDVRPIRPPSVPQNSCRFRVSLNVDLEEAVLDEFSETLASILYERAGVVA
ncbi:MAG TPA: 8-amino-7-oxononanoate synthase [Pyrinomonadaceae bacterium]|nr:8-amino-7-oxononanoate synthase [Pyrinomonadaceae bacterium]